MTTEILTQAQLTSVLEGNLHQKVPTRLYDSNLSSKYEEVKKITGVSSTEGVVFDPEIHLQYYADPEAAKVFNCTRKRTMEELGVPHKDQISNVGVSDPFPLFTMAAVHLMRQEVLGRELFLEFARFLSSSTTGMDVGVRGYVKNEDKILAPFTYLAWTHPKTMDLVSRMAGVEMEIVMDYEIAHLNVSITDDATAKAAAAAAQHDKSDSGKNIPAIVGWHNDSYPFVCVLMLSDTTDMIGGETFIRKGNGDVDCVEGPQQGYGSVLQGRLIEHMAPSPVGLLERLTMVTSYRAKNNFDKSVLTGVKPEINYGLRFTDFYSQWIQYRTDLVQNKLEELQRARKFNDEFAKDEAIRQLQSLESYIRITWNQMTVNDSEWERAKLGFKELKV